MKTALKFGRFGLLSFSLVMYVLAVLLIPLRFQVKLEGAGHWLKTNTSEKSVIFTSNWSDFPVLFYDNTQNYYLFGLDPVYCYAYDTDVWNRWVAVVSGQSEKPSQGIKKEKGAT